MENALPLITTEEVFNVLENTYYQLTDIIKNTAPGVIGRNTTVEFGPEYTKSYYVGNYEKATKTAQAFSIDLQSCFSQKNNEEYTSVRFNYKDTGYSFSKILESKRKYLERQSYSNGSGFPSAYVDSNLIEIAKAIVHDWAFIKEVAKNGLNSSAKQISRSEKALGEFFKETSYAVNNKEPHTGSIKEPSLEFMTATELKNYALSKRASNAETSGMTHLEEWHKYNGKPLLITSSKVILEKENDIYNTIADSIKKSVIAEFIPPEYKNDPNIEKKLINTINNKLFESIHELINDTFDVVINENISLAILKENTEDFSYSFPGYYSEGDIFNENEEELYAEEDNIR